MYWLLFHTQNNLIGQLKNDSTPVFCLLCDLEPCQLLVGLRNTPLRQILIELFNKILLPSRNQSVCPSWREGFLSHHIQKITHECHLLELLHEHWWQKGSILPQLKGINETPADIPWKKERLPDLSQSYKGITTVMSVLLWKLCQELSEKWLGTVKITPTRELVIIPVVPFSGFLISSS